MKESINGNILNLKVSIIEYLSVDYLYYISKLTLFQSCIYRFVIFFNKARTKWSIEVKKIFIDTQIV